MIVPPIYNIIIYCTYNKNTMSRVVFKKFLN
jgi:hypothetical protein